MFSLTQRLRPLSFVPNVDHGHHWCRHALPDPLPLTSLFAFLLSNPLPLTLADRTVHQLRCLLRPRGHHQGTCCRPWPPLGHCLLLPAATSYHHMRKPPRDTTAKQFHYSCIVIQPHFSIAVASPDSYLALESNPVSLDPNQCRFGKRRSSNKYRCHHQCLDPTTWASIVLVDILSQSWAPLAKKKNCPADSYYAPSQPRIRNRPPMPAPSWSTAPIGSSLGWAVIILGHQLELTVLQAMYTNNWLYERLVYFIS